MLVDTSARLRREWTTPYNRQGHNRNRMGLTFVGMPEGKRADRVTLISLMNQARIS
jgi:hypothetical protein